MDEAEFQNGFMKLYENLQRIPKELLGRSPKIYDQSNDPNDQMMHILAQYVNPMDLAQLQSPIYPNITIGQFQQYVPAEAILYDISDPN